jgi:Mlc titration factor MtfA (ptsG expression regulator)
MNGFIYLLLLVALIVVSVIYLPDLLLRRVLARPFPRAFSKILRENIPVYSRMPVDLQLQLKRLIRQFLHQKKFVACGGLVMTDVVRVTIAARACLLLLNRSLQPERVYPDLRMVLVYPSAFVAPHVEMTPGGIVTHGNQTLSGESWSDGRVILAWDHVQKNNAHLPDGHDVVVHEFAHQLDSESGRTNGAPLMMNKVHYERWSDVLTEEFAILQHAAQTGSASVLDYYGATNPAEFFAVATEAFFEKPWQLGRHRLALFDQMRAYYQVDPRDWRDDPG